MHYLPNSRLTPTDKSETEIKGIGYEKGCTHRDPSDIIKVGDTYYV